mmetsp:Transcript_96948/g.278522  ORF Transcript_96948/g.278522 Transcript_96948/m.278522 type:complete len:283 (+) Transcript_96948:121-969(+)
MHRGCNAVLEVAPNLGIRLGRRVLVLLVATRGAVVVAGLLLLHKLARELVAVREHPDTFAMWLVVPELPGVEGAVWEDPLADNDLALLPVADQLRPVLCVGVAAEAVLLADLPLANVDVSVDIGECAIGRNLTSCGALRTPSLTTMEVAEVSTSARWRVLVRRLLVLLADIGPVGQLSKAVLPVLLVLALVRIPKLLPTVAALAPAQPLHVCSVVGVAVQVERIALAGVLLRALLQGGLLAFDEELVLGLLLLISHASGEGSAKAEPAREHKITRRTTDRQG